MTVTATTSGTSALSAKAAGTRFIRFHTTGATEMAISISTMPPTAGVRMRRSVGICQVKRKVKRAESAARLASSAGPPCCSAVTETAMKAALEPTNMTWPEPMRPSRETCSQVESPAATMAANISQPAVPSSMLAERATTSGVSMMPVTIMATICAPIPAASRCGGFSSGS